MRSPLPSSSLVPTRFQSRPLLDHPRYLRQPLHWEDTRFRVHSHTPIQPSVIILPYLEQEDGPVLVASSSIPLQQDPSPPRVSQGAFQALPYFGSMQQFHQAFGQKEQEILWRSGFRGSGSTEKKDDHKGCFNYKKPGHFIVECLKLQKDKPNKGSIQKDKFKNKFKKSLMEIWDELDNEEDSQKDEEQANLALMTLTSYKAKPDSNAGSESKEEDKEFSKLSRSDLITFMKDIMGRCQEKSNHMKILKKTI
ncbi:hypothetical protein KIW84_032327 [Lathyrus oleraceus]|uniref:Uncharacterized protein n=1 Tax=Pisum sativum TaxID=3888 RepID=A0A9D4XX72_PEA|nr:hypothetical protein KIW84_032327 [Pisum sativum]